MDFYPLADSEFCKYIVLFLLDSDAEGGKLVKVILKVPMAVEVSGDDDEGCVDGSATLSDPASGGFDWAV